MLLHAVDVAGGRRPSPSAVCQGAILLWLGPGASASPTGSVPPSLEMCATGARRSLVSVKLGHHAMPESRVSSPQSPDADLVFPGELVAAASDPYC